MLNELEEFRAYTAPPVYAAKGKRDNSYLGRMSRFSWQTFLCRAFQTKISGNR